MPTVVRPNATRRSCTTVPADDGTAMAAPLAKSLLLGRLTKPWAERKPVPPRAEWHDAAGWSVGRAVTGDQQLRPDRRRRRREHAAGRFHQAGFTSSASVNTRLSPISPFDTYAELYPVAIESKPHRRDRSLLAARSIEPILLALTHSRRRLGSLFGNLTKAEFAALRATRSRSEPRRTTPPARTIRWCGCAPCGRSAGPADPRVLSSAADIMQVVNQVVQDVDAERTDGEHRSVGPLSDPSPTARLTPMRKRPRHAPNCPEYRSRRPPDRPPSSVPRLR